MRVAARNRQKFTENSYFKVLRSFKVIDVDTNKKLVTSACYAKQDVCTYLPPFSRILLLRVKITSSLVNQSKRILSQTHQIYSS